MESYHHQSSLVYKVIYSFIMDNPNKKDPNKEKKIEIIKKLFDDKSHLKLDKLELPQCECTKHYVNDIYTDPDSRLTLIVDIPNEDSKEQKSLSYNLTSQHRKRCLECLLQWQNYDDDTPSGFWRLMKVYFYFRIYKTGESPHTQKHTSCLHQSLNTPPTPQNYDPSKVQNWLKSLK